MSSSVVQHYQEGSLMSRVLQGLDESSIDIATLTPAQLHPIDQFHIGGLKALRSLLSHVDIKPGARVLDLGCGLGGTCRVIAGQHPDARVLGVDITPEFIEVSKTLTKMVNMENINYEVGSGTEIPAPDASVDVMVMVYVGMNIEDKDALFTEACRVLAPGGVFAVKDVVLEENKTSDDILYPVPWATEPAQSAATHQQAYLDAAAHAGLELLQGPQLLREEGMGFANSLPPSGPPPLSLPRITFGLNGLQKMKNVVSLLKTETIIPCEMIFQKKQSE
eukprot:CAMPEP_0114415770 /NCGR_PEP_ID=MMETSP0103-20121206/2082_1 /TAXON_ID=37642 ORGANISM="Paraphysomonas imperforata, Strain PA2" /NCGR_SAMPLE_ID=MMETSP0103 /ASSEMBLY_ACC=CAM_ASM_000201 /LENGTH=277 /DNA_ID=CAMNT_0001583967 /DNA_START=62 /DNA_END=895 /DNA_ORIENTATION=-